MTSTDAPTMTSDGSIDTSLGVESGVGDWICIWAVKGTL